jgi:hypothetical protein
MSPVDVVSMIGNLDLTAINALSPSEGDSALATEAGTPSEAGSSSVAVGDIIEFQGSGTGWKVVTPNVNGVPPEGARALLASSGIQSPHTSSIDNGKVAVWDGASLGPVEYNAPENGSNITCNGGVNNNSVSNGKKFIYNGTVPSGEWSEQNEGGDGAGPESVLGAFYAGERQVTQINAVPSAWLYPGMTFHVVGAAGTPSIGSSDLLTGGDVTEFDGTSWKKTISAVAGKVPEGTRLAVAFGNKYSPATNNQGKIATWDGVSNTPTIVDQAEGTTLTVEDVGNLYERREVIKRRTGNNGAWVNVSPMVWEARKDSTVIPSEVFSSWGEVLSLQMNLPRGKYKITWHAALRVDDDTYGAYFRVQADGTSIGPTVGYYFFDTLNGSGSTHRIPESGSDTVTFAGDTVHIFDMDVARQHTDGAVWVYFSHLTVEKVQA